MATVVTSEVTISVKAQGFIEQIKALWQEVHPHYMRMGEYFSRLRAETERYRKSHQTGITYATAVRRTGVPRSSAEFYRNLYETCQALDISSETFIALQDSGVNLASSKYYDKAKNELRFIDLQEIRNLDATDGEAVERTAEKLKAAATKQRPVRTLLDLEKAIWEAADVAAELSAEDWTKAAKKWGALFEYLLQQQTIASDPATDNNQS